MKCYNCGRTLSEKDFCTACGADVALYKKIMYMSNMYYNDGLEKANVRDLSGAVTSLRQSLKFNKKNITDMSNIFSGCVYLNELNISNFNTNNVTNMSNMFSVCHGLKDINISYAILLCSYILSIK